MMVTPTLAANAQAARDRLAQLEADHASAVAVIPAYQTKANAAVAKLADTERRISQGDNRVGAADLLDLDTAKRHAALVAEGAHSKAANLAAQLPEARTDALLAELEAGEHPLAWMEDADAKFQAAIVAALRGWRETAAEHHAAWAAVAYDVKAYDHRVNVTASGSILEIEGESYRGILPGSEFDQERNFKAARSVLIREDDITKAEARAAEAKARAEEDAAIREYVGW